ncbi:hypothetical protein NDU88_003519 [Pleurodeles waltl]|uniref:Uncharacterized protein n=1 Tax=Pleurodeles waltl TaxID=8319 RepID=A0AAV7V1Z8_PLEWA|nr:hypothetical protein NDU88_003519 [Pleurodeles waltl]
MRAQGTTAWEGLNKICDARRRIHRVPRLALPLQKAFMQRLRRQKQFSTFSDIRAACLKADVCSQNYSCVVTTLDVQPSAVRCVFYPETQTCTHSLEGRHCQLLLKEPAAYIYRRQGKPGPLHPRISCSEPTAEPN